MTTKKEDMPEATKVVLKKLALQNNKEEKK
jgi:hypothetical protein